MRTWLAGLLIMALAGCSSAEPEASPEPTPTPSSTPNSPTPTASGWQTPTPSTPPDTNVKRLVVPPAAEAMAAPWQERFVVPYGPGKALLGTSPGGDSGMLDIGPEYGAPGPDGSWWILDYAKGRLAHFDADGVYLDQLKIDKKLLVNGRYYQWQLPHVLADGSLVASRYGDPSSYLYRVIDGTADEIVVDGDFSPEYDDGVSLFGFAGGTDDAKVDPLTGELERVEYFTTPSGSRFRISMDFDRGRLRIELPDAGVTRSLKILSSSGARARVGFEVVAGADDTLHLFLVGAGEDDESLQLAGYTSVSPTGVVTPVEPLADPFSEADPGSPANLTIAPGSSTPMLIYIRTDGVHVYERTG